MLERYSLKNIIKFLKARYAPRGARQSYSQYGEDIIVLQLLKKLGMSTPSYIDIGAHHPVFGNNTYLFYRNGGRGVLVEPNKALAQVISKMRPGDKCVSAGVGRKDGDMNFYSFSQSTRSTFSERQAQEWQKHSGQSPIVEKVPVLSLDSIIREYCRGDAPDIVSIDAEGLDEDIVKGYSWKVRPKIFCIESTDSIDGYMRTVGYDMVARIFQNSIFIDKEINKS